MIENNGIFKERIQQEIEILLHQGKLSDQFSMNTGNDQLHTILGALEKLSENTPSILWSTEISRAGELINTYISPKVNDYLKLEPGTIKDNFYIFFDYIRPDHLSLVMQGILDALKNPGVIQQVHYEIRRADGERGWFFSSGTVYIDQGKIYLFGSTNDVSDWVTSNKKLEQKEKLLLTIAENYPNSYVSIIESDYRIGFTSGQEFLKQNLDPSSFIGLTLEEVFGNQADFVRAKYQRTFNGEQLNFDLYINNQNQRYKTVPLFNDNGKINQILVVVENITEQTSIQVAIDEKNIQYEALFERSNDAIFFIDLNGIIFDVNHKGVDLLGYSKNELIGKHTDYVVAPEERNHANTVRGELINGNHSPIYHRTLIKKDGTGIKVEVNVSTVLDLHGKPLYLQSVVRDITERVLAEKTLRESEQRYRTYVENAPNAIFVVDQFGNYLEVNQAACDLTGYSKRELLSMSVRELASPDSPPETRNSFHTLVEEGFVKSELVLRKKEGSDIYVMLRAVKLTETRFIGFCLDHTKEVLAEEEVREREAYFRTLFESAGDAIFINDLNDHIVEVNQKACDLLGYSRNELIQMTVPELQAPEERGKSGSVIKEELVYTRQKPFETTDLHKNGTKIPVEVSTVPLTLKDRQLAISIVRNISERKEAEQKRHVLEERFSKAFHTSPDAININRLKDGLYLEINKGFTDLTGFSKEDIDGKTSFDIDIWVNKEDREKLVKGLREKGEVRNLEAKFRFKDGSIKIGLMSAVILDVNGEPCILSISRDITDRLEAIRLANEKSEWINTIYGSMNDAVFVHPYQEEGFANFIEVNEIAVERYGYTREEFFKISPNQITLYEEVQQQARQVFRAELLKNRNFIEETTHIKKSGEKFPVEINSNIVDYNGQKVILAVVRDISERKKAEQEIKRSTNELARLYRASSVLLPSRSAELEPLAQAIVNAVLVEFEHSNCSLILIEPEQNLLNRIAVAGPYSEEVRRGMLLLNGKGLVPKTISSGKTLNTPDVLLDPAYIPNWKESRSELVVPLTIEGNVIGVLDIQSKKVGAFSENDERLMGLFAERAALAIHSARLYGDARRRLERLSALRNIDQAITGNLDLNITLEIVVNQIIQQLEVDAADILLYQSDFQQLRYAAGSGFRSQTFQYTKLRLGAGCAGKAAYERQIIHLENLEKQEHEFSFSPSFHEEEFVEYFGVPLISKGNVIGVLEIFNREKVEYDSEWLSFLDTLAGQSAIAIDNINLFSKLQKSNMELIHAYDSTIEGWAHALEMRDMETEGHSRRVVELTLNIARMMGVNDQELIHIRRGALLHDIGKIGVPDRILQKPGPLSAEEWVIMKEHPNYAFNLLSPIQYLKPALDIPYSHHEKWDGSGYPRGLKGEAIPLAARIFAIVDVWDALLSDRPYRKAWMEEQVVEYLKEQSGKHFDPVIVQRFLEHFQINKFS